MTDCASARHRAPRRASTPLSTLGTGIALAVNDRVAAIGRGGAVIAVSSGLVASMGLPASALSDLTATDGPLTASLPLDPVDGSAAAAPGAAELPAPAAPLDAAPQPAPTAPLQPAPAAPLTPAPPAAAVASPVTPVTRSAIRAQLRAAKAAPITTAAVKAAVKAGSAVAAPAAGSAVLALAARYVGVRYRYGGSSPSGFDCSGYVQYVYKHLGFHLPRTANQQLHAVRRVSRSQARLGDLVFFVYGGYATHVAFYAGNGMMYDSAHHGTRIAKRKIYSSSVVFGRVVG